MFTHMWHLLLVVLLLVLISQLLFPGAYLSRLSAASFKYMLRWDGRGGVWELVLTDSGTALSLETKQRTANSAWPKTFTHILDRLLQTHC